MARRVAQADAALDQLLGPLLAHEIAAIAAIDTAVAAEQHPDYVVMYYGLKTGKQANVEQMVTLIRRGGGVPPERAGVLKYVMQAQSAIAGRISGTTAAVEILRMNRNAKKPAVACLPCDTHENRVRSRRPAVSCAP